MALGLSVVSKSETERGGRYAETVLNYVRYHLYEGSTPATQRNYKVKLELFGRWLCSQGLEYLGDVTKEDVLNYLGWMKERGTAPTTIKKRFGTLRSFFAWCVDWDYCQTNPVAQLKTPRAPQKAKGFVTKDQYLAILDICSVNTFLGARRQSMFRLMKTTGLRLNEMTMLRWEDLNWEDGSIHILHGKGGKERVIPFERDVKQAIMRYQKFRKDSLPNVWVSEDKNPHALPNQAIYKDVKRTMERAGVYVKDACHIWRRTWAANAVKAGIPRPYVQGIAGWSTTAMLDRYTAQMVGSSEALEAFRDFDPWG